MIVLHNIFFAFLLSAVECRPSDTGDVVSRYSGPTNLKEYLTALGQSRSNTNNESSEDIIDGPEETELPNKTKERDFSVPYLRSYHQGNRLSHGKRDTISSWEAKELKKERPVCPTLMIGCDHEDGDVKCTKNLQGKNECDGDDNDSKDKSGGTQNKDLSVPRVKREIERNSNNPVYYVYPSKMIECEKNDIECVQNFKDNEDCDDDEDRYIIGTFVKKKTVPKHTNQAPDIKPTNKWPKKPDVQVRPTTPRNKWIKKPITPKKKWNIKFNIKAPAIALRNKWLKWTKRPYKAQTTTAKTKLTTKKRKSPKKPESDYDDYFFPEMPEIDLDKELKRKLKKVEDYIYD